MYENAEDFKIVDVLIMLVITHTNESKAIVALTGKSLDTLWTKISPTFWENRGNYSNDISWTIYVS